ncbi:MAG TPA: bifunctional phosphoribosylaminoimidazolecarboxamide formyltransferase/IMP cyclohydrolase [bacterium]|nr:bifunctional phosphoribosylaminoimidazolecarboxamide formyltransferase/IMP cyclohydrolase [bacterium]
MIKRALLSVADKAGIVELARGLAALGCEIISTGGTAAALREAGVPVSPLETLTGFPEILGGRVKTLHPAVHGGLLAVRAEQRHTDELERHGIRPIDLVAVTLYPFAAALARGSGEAALIEEIDIGGVTLLRAGAKNFHDVIVLSDPAQYGPVLEELREGRGVRLETRRGLAREAFRRTAAYDRAIGGWLEAASTAGGSRPDTGAPAEPGGFPPQVSLAFEKIQDLRYGENPHQRGAFYRDRGDGAVDVPTVASARRIAGKALSYNNIYDLDAALEVVREFAETGAVVVKHGIPCGAAIAGSVRDAYVRARDGDPVSAFGGIVALNRRVDRATAEAISETFLEAVIAPGFDAAASEVLGRKKAVRLLETGPLGPVGPQPGLDWRRVRGGLLLQDRDAVDLVEAGLKVVTPRKPTNGEWGDLRFAWTVCRHVRSNAIVFARDRCVVGVGSGQTNRVEPVRIAGRVAGERARGACMASEAFFPFPDGVEAAAEAGITAVIQPGGSRKDAEVIAAAAAAGMAMVLTGIRHFKH